MLLGLDECVRTRHEFLAGKNFGLLMNRASVDRHLDLACDVLDAAYPHRLKSLFTPQHGLWGDAQANMIESDHDRHRRLGIPIHSLYSETRSPTAEMLSDLDCFVVDLQDVGTRVYTYAWTMLECMKVCDKVGVPMLVLDRPNPIGGTIVEGPLLKSGCESFVGGATIPMRHGLTIGELARLFRLERNLQIELDVVAMQGWPTDSASIGQCADGPPWIAPSPNLPRIESALVYPGQVLLEGTNLSEGRGTTLPFEVVGAPYLDAFELCRQLTDLALQGVKFLPIHFRPTFDKWAGEICAGVSIHVTDRNLFRPYAMTVKLLSIVLRTWGDDFCWLDPPYEYETEKPPIDIISGSDALRKNLTPDSADELCEVNAEEWQSRARPALLYPRPW